MTGVHHPIAGVVFLIAVTLIAGTSVRGSHAHDQGAAAPAQDGWKTLSRMPSPRLSPGLVTVNGRLFLVGGGLVSGSRVETFDTLHEYSPASDRWVARAPMPTARSNFGTAVVGHLLYVIGGTRTDSAAPPVATVEAYDAMADRWVPDPTC